MKNYRITVNGVAYEVSVEEIGAEEMQEAAQQEAAVRPAPAVQPKPAAKKASAAAGTAGSVKINAPMPGKIVEVKVQPGASVKKGDVAVILEAMKMENEIRVGQDGTIASVEVSAGDMVEGGSVLVTMD